MKSSGVSIVPSSSSKYTIVRIQRPHGAAFTSMSRLNRFKNEKS
jgi:hypothetical protein